MHPPNDVPPDRPPEHLAERLPARADIESAQVRLVGLTRHTPWLRIHGHELGLRVPVVLKLESMQHTGSFKVRGALNALLAHPLPAVAAASGGNHGAAVAWAAQQLGIPATLFIPETSPALKVDRIRSYGAQVRLVPGYYGEAANALADYVAETGVGTVHAYDQPEVVAGQGTLGREIIDELPETTHILVAVGGGGLSSGVTLACTGQARVIPVEPMSCPTMAAAFTAHGPVDVEVGGVAADSTGARRAGRIAYSVLASAGEPVVAVSDADIVAAQHFLWRHARVAAEPGGAVALAGLLSGAYQPPPGASVVVVVCGGNVDLSTIQR